LSLYEDIEYVWDTNEDFIISKISRWVTDIEGNKAKIKNARRKFHAWKPIRVYTSTTEVKKRVGSVNFSLRYYGQEIANLIVKNEMDVLFDISAKHTNNNIRDFKIKSPKGRFAWDGEEGKKLRAAFKYFHNKMGGIKRPVAKECEVESRLIEELEKRSRKKFKGIQPIMIGGCPLQIPTPISGNSGKPILTDGNIDILARRRCSDNRVRLSVWELKRPKAFAHAVDQAYIYAITLLFMLRSECGQKWYKLFGFNKKIPKHLEIEAAVVITKDQKKKFDKRIGELKRINPFKVRRDKIKFAVAYYNKDTFMIEEFDEVL
jgi:hypothetical protein